VVRPFPRKPIKPAGSKYGTVANTDLAAQPLDFLRCKGKKGLSLRWRSFLGLGNERVICVFSYNAVQYIYFASRGQCSPLIVEYVKLKIFDAALMLISRMGQQGYRLSCRLSHRTIHSICRDVTMELFDCQMHNTNNRWHTVDARIEQIKMPFVQPIILCNESHSHYWHPILGF